MKVLYPTFQSSFSTADGGERHELDYYLREFIRDCSVTNSWSASTIRSSHVLASHLHRFGQARDLEFFDQEGLDRYVLYLRRETRMQESSCRKQFKNLRWFLLWAIRKGFTQETAVLSYRPKFKVVEKPVIFLSPDELSRLYHFPIPQGRPELERVRDLFCFCAFTSLRYSDMVGLWRGDIREGALHVVTKKTIDRIRIELVPQAQAILDKYADRHFPEDRALPYMPNQRMNDLLKELCRLCGLDTPIREVYYRNGRREERLVPKWAKMTTHAGRRTFICFALANGIPPQVVMKWTGHADYQSMQPYIDVAERTRLEAMLRLGKVWEESLGG